MHLKILVLESKSVHRLGTRVNILEQARQWETTTCTYKVMGEGKGKTRCFLGVHPGGGGMWCIYKEHPSAGTCGADSVRRRPLETYTLWYWDRVDGISVGV